MAEAGKYVCAFRGRRDYYQVPLALAEAGRLERFITDAYASPAMRAAAAYLPNGIREKAQFRHAIGIPDDRVSCLWGTTAMEHFRHRLGCSPSLTFARLDQNFSRAAERCARHTRAHLFLYSPYAWEAFTASYPHDPRRVLFQYHPHPDYERRILNCDYGRYPFVAASYAEACGARLDEPLRRRERECWRQADRILCASTFTRDSLVEAGATAQDCRIIPYGIEVPRLSDEIRTPQAFDVLFVGSGSQRKGLHHLLLAWQLASLPQKSSLTLVCRAIDKGIARMLDGAVRVRMVPGASVWELSELYRNSALLAMPSLVEGFGQVYLESLAQGCPVLGTPNTCLPDLGGEKDGIFTISPGNVDELVCKLESLAPRLAGNGEIRWAARACAERFPWRRFRERLISSLPGN